MAFEMRIEAARRDVVNDDGRRRTRSGTKRLPAGDAPWAPAKAIARANLSRNPDYRNAWEAHAVPPMFEDG